MRRYRARLRVKGIRVQVIARRDPVLNAVRFKRDSLLTPGEQDVLRRFCAGLARAPALPLQLAVFGSRVTGTSDQRSDLDLALVVNAEMATSDFQEMLSRLALRAQAPYREGAYGIFLKPMLVEKGGRSALLASIREHSEVIWTRPRSPTKSRTI